MIAVLPPRTMMLAELFPDEDYRFVMRFGRGQPGDFFGPTAQRAELLAQRRRWLTESPRTYAALLPEGEALLDEAIEAAQTWNGFMLPSAAKSAWDKCLALGQFWEPDYLLLKGDADGEIRLCGGSLCFPSSWRLTDKIGKSMEIIHEPVPGLNAAIGAGLHKFLTALKPGAASLRHNWGLARSPELNHHPDRGLPRLDASVSENEVWLRVEHQALVALPKSGGILFGIRIANHSLAEVRADPAATQGLCRALATMPEAMARYKNLTAAREAIMRLLKS